MPFAAPPAPDPVIEQAHRDLENGLVDTDLHSTPGTDAERRRKRVPDDPRGPDRPWPVGSR